VLGEKGGKERGEKKWLRGREKKVIRERRLKKKPGGKKRPV